MTTPTYMVTFPGRMLIQVIYCVGFAIPQENEQSRFAPPQTHAVVLEGSIAPRNSGSWSLSKGDDCPTLPRLLCCLTKPIFAGV